MLIPRWVVIVAAVWVLAFGAYRVSIAIRQQRRPASPDRPNFSKRGLWGQSPRRHIILGSFYLFMGVILIGMAMGWIDMREILGGK